MIVKFYISTQDLRINSNYSLNKYYSGIHWKIRQKDADYIHALVIHELKMEGVPEVPFKKPVEMHYYFNDRLDLSNHGAVVKMIEDALKGWVLIDDSRKYVKKITQEFWDKDFIKVEVKEYESK